MEGLNKSGIFYFFFLETRAKVGDEQFDVDLAESVLKSDLRRRAAATTIQNDPKYAGQKADRSVLFEESSKPKSKSDKLAKHFDTNLSYGLLNL